MIINKKERTKERWIGKKNRKPRRIKKERKKAEIVPCKKERNVERTPNGKKERKKEM